MIIRNIDILNKKGAYVPCICGVLPKFVEDV